MLAAFYTLTTIRETLQMQRPGLSMRQIALPKDTLNSRNIPVSMLAPQAVTMVPVLARAHTHMQPVVGAFAAERQREGVSKVQPGRHFRFHIARQHRSKLGGKTRHKQ